MASAEGSKLERDCLGREAVELSSARARPVLCERKVSRESVRLIETTVRWEP
jgi:hypothetical protein